ncbi:MAG: hypothetical protein ACJATD_000448 [Alloalcanivorax sp.]
MNRDYFLLAVFSFYLLFMLANIIKGKHTPPLSFWFSQSPEVDATYRIWWVVYGFGFLAYLILFLLGLGYLL